jgi:nucleoside 2-deoxyribosyltransferase
MNIYIASPLHTFECKAEIRAVVHYLREIGQNVYAPMELKIPDAWDLPNQVWAKKVYDNDIEQLNKADLIICIYRGFKFAGGTGTAWELGYAVASGKDVIVLCTDIEAKQSLMIINSAKIVEPYGDYQKAFEEYLAYKEGKFETPYINPRLQDQS